MKQSDPPRAATWLLQHLAAGERNEALAGDLLEEFRSGRSGGWYWRQVLAYVAITNTRVVLGHAGALLFAGLWALLAPSWLPLTRPGEFRWLDPRILGLAWPWSSLCEVGLTFSILISFVWAGLVLYLLLESVATRRFSFRRLRGGAMRSAAVFAPLYVGFRALTLILPGSGIRLARAAAHHPLGPFLLGESICVPFFLTLLWAIWDASRGKYHRKAIARHGR
ncbi:MAG TPA: hypothetical protein VF730_08490 [Terracidiphilus sp.]